MDYQTYYAAIEKPFFAPEPWVFGLAWGIIYPLIFIAAIMLVLQLVRGTLYRPYLTVSLFALNLIANFAFTPLQLQFPTTSYATLDILLVVGTLAVLQILFFKRQWVLFLLLLPYLLWGVFATVLQITIYFTNFA